MYIFSFNIILTSGSINYLLIFFVGVTKRILGKFFLKSQLKTMTSFGSNFNDQYSIKIIVIS